MLTLCDNISYHSKPRPMLPQAVADEVAMEGAVANDWEHTTEPEGWVHTDYRGMRGIVQTSPPG